MNKKYNGWKNKATWLLNLYMNNDYKSQFWLNEYSRICIHQNGGQYFIPNGRLLEEMADVLQDDMTENLLRLDVQGQESRILKEDLLRIALSQIDWLGLVKSNIIDYIKANEITTNR